MLEKHRKVKGRETSTIGIGIGISKFYLEM